MEIICSVDLWDRLAPVATIERRGHLGDGKPGGTCGHFVEDNGRPDARRAVDANDY